MIFWGDESGLRSDDVRGRSYPPRGETPVARPSHRRVNLGLVSAATNRGEVRWMVLDGAITAPSLIRFLERLVRDAGRKVFLILDRLQAHRAGLVRAWLDGRQDQIEVFYLPAYSPDLNPDEGLNGDVKQAVTAKPLARSKGQLKQAVGNHMRSFSRRLERMRSFFRHPGIVNLIGFKACAVVRQYSPKYHTAIWTHASCRHTRQASARARRY